MLKHVPPVHDSQRYCTNGFLVTLQYSGFVRGQQKGKAERHDDLITFFMSEISKPGENVGVVALRNRTSNTTGFNFICIENCFTVNPAR